MCGPKDGKSLFSGLAAGESSWSQHRQRRLLDHGKERKELLSLTLQQVWLSSASHACVGGHARGCGGGPWTVVGCRGARPCLPRFLLL